MKFEETERKWLIVGLKEECQQMGITMKDLAKALEISPQYLSDIAKQRRAVREPMRKRIVMILRNGDSRNAYD